tara:strand:+ start:333 stop:494 length:162 start_codon:yes stop_codon:yes gene_type:complete
MESTYAQDANKSPQAANVVREIKSRIIRSVKTRRRNNALLYHQEFQEVPTLQG